jgi:hypothetical protein
MGSALHCEIARSKGGSTVEAQDIARLNIGHEERQPDVITFRQEVWFCVELSNHVVRLLAGEVRELRHEGFRHLERGGEVGRDGLFLNGEVGACCGHETGRLGLGLGLGVLRTRSGAEW